MEEWANIAKVAIAVVAVGGAIWGIILLTWKISAWKTGADKDRSALREDAENDRSAIKDFMKEIRDDIKRIFERLPTSTTAAESPIKLTDLGIAISGNLAADKWAEEKAGCLADQLQNKHPYEIQELCFEFVENEENYPPTMITNMRTSANEHGIEMDQVKGVFAVELRDVLLRRFGQKPPE